MREIKFRAWHKSAPKAEYKMTYWKLGSGLDRSVFYDSAVSGEFGPGAVMQFTGLKDINEKDSYYGDIIEHSTTEGGIFRRVLSWSDELCTLMVDNFPYYRLHESGYIQPSKLEFEIIGNIYENPELLKN